MVEDHGQDVGQCPAQESGPPPGGGTEGPSGAWGQIGGEIGHQ